MSQTTAGSMPYVLPVELTVSTVVPDAARDTLVAEAERIWLRENVRLHWYRRGVDAIPAEASPLRVLVLSRPSPASPRWAVGELVPLSERRAMAIISVDGARRVIDEARRLRPVHTLGGDRGLGLVLGRAVAHEIGHYLLGTGTHSMSGLMRPGFHAREFADLHSASTFLLDDHASRWVRERIVPAEAHARARQGPGPSVFPVRGFSYPSAGR